jgi:hypothetical protein
MDKWVPNPASNTSLHLSMFAFVGKLMGIAIRGKHFLNLDLPSIVWKQLVGAEVTMNDVDAIDTLTVKLLHRVTHPEEENITEETFSDYLDLNFTTTGADGKELELFPGGSQKRVTWSNRIEYVRLVETLKLTEFRVATEAILAGLSTQVPSQLLALFSWQELELSVCGKREIDVQYLKENTQYSGGIGPTEQHVTWFWEVLEESSHKERELFLRFVWGRSRLPLTSEDWEQRFVLMPCHRPSPDLNLPMSHTCFNQLELPRYSAKHILRDKLKYAINECRAIDTDHQAQNIDWDNEEDEPREEGEEGAEDGEEEDPAEDEEDENQEENN